LAGKNVTNNASKSTSTVPISNRNKEIQNAPTAIDGPAFILVEPQLGANIGAACRAMWNFGLSDLRLVRPRDGWPNKDAEVMASGASVVLDAARIYDTTVDAASEITTLYATTARERDMTKPILTPREAVVDMLKKRAAGEQVGILFGRERTGLENEDVMRANKIIAVPANPAFASLNLGQCALLLAYEWRQVAAENIFTPREVAPEAALAPQEAVDNLYHRLELLLDEANYFWPEKKRPAMAQSIRNLLSRTPMNDQDVRMMHGVFRTLAEHRRHRPVPISSRPDIEKPTAPETEKDENP
jgi:tRNA/rRNA methyltransferase